MCGDTNLWNDLSTLTKIAAVFSVLGKMIGFMTFFTFFVNLQLAKWMLLGYATFIGINIILSGRQMFKIQKSQRPPREQVRERAREYSLIEGK